MATSLRKHRNQVWIISHLPRPSAEQAPWQSVGFFLTLPDPAPPPAKASLNADSSKVLCLSVRLWECVSMSVWNLCEWMANVCEGMRYLWACVCENLGEDTCVRVQDICKHVGVRMWVMLCVWKQIYVSMYMCKNVWESMYVKIHCVCVHMSVWECVHEWWMCVGRGHFPIWTTWLSLQSEICVSVNSQKRTMQSYNTFCSTCFHLPLPQCCPAGSTEGWREVREPPKGSWVTHALVLRV